MRAVAPLLLLCALAVAALALLWLRKPRSTMRRGPRSPGPGARTAGRASPPEVRPPQAASPQPGLEAKSTVMPPELADFELARLESLDVGPLARVAHVCASMPAPHPIHRMMATGLDSPEELKEAVTVDAGLTASILRTVNSAAFALASPITSVQHAITYLGAATVKGVVAQAALVESASGGTPEARDALDRIWKSAFFASAFAQALGQELGMERPSVLATKSLFFNLGDVAILHGVEGAAGWYEEGVTLLQRVRSQQDCCGANTAVVGSQLASVWNLPDELATAIEQGYLPLCTPPAEHPMDGDALRQNVLVYLAGRAGDRVTYFGLRDIADLDLEDSDNPALYYLPTYLGAAGLERVPSLLKSPAFRRKANRLMNRLGP